MEMPPPPPYGAHDFIEPTFSKDIRIDPAALTAWSDKLEQGGRDLVPIQERLDALSFAMTEGWRPPRVIENKIDHLNRVISGRFVAKYLRDVLGTLQEGEADLIAWQRMLPAQRAERLAQREREKVEAEERRQKQAEISQRQNAFYSAFFAAGISPIPMSAKAIAASAQALTDTERRISNAGSHLYE